jgi:2-alkenal reductase
MERIPRRVWARRTLAAVPPVAVLLLLGVAVSATVLVPEVRRLVSPTATSVSASSSGGVVRAAAAVLRVTGTDSFQALSPALVTVDAESAGESEARRGGGFIWDNAGHIVTSANLVRGSQTVNVTLHGGIRVSATVQAVDDHSDLAVLNLSEALVPLATLPLGESDRVAVGDPVMLFDPSGRQKVYRGTIQAVGKLLPIGAVIADGAQYSIPDIIATDLRADDVRIGAPLFNSRGEVIGLSLPITTTGKAYAVPVSLMQRVIPALISRGAYDHPWLGLSGRTVTPELADALGLPVGQGVLILTILPNSPAAAAGLRPGNAMIQFGNELLRVGGDVIVSVDGRPMPNTNALVTHIARHGTAGKPVTLEIIRDGRSQTVTVILGTRPAIPILD